MTVDRDFFFKNVREHPFGGLDQQQVDGLNTLLDLWDRNYSHNPLSYLAYCLATVFHETARTMRPIAEIGHGRGRAYGPSGFYGRGYVQITWESNYAKATKMLATHNVIVNLVKHPEQALDPKIAGLVLYDGMITGMFTGKKLANYIPHDPLGARRIINGTDRAATIEGYYKSFLAALRPAPVSAPVSVVEAAPRPVSPSAPVSLAVPAAAPSSPYIPAAQPPVGSPTVVTPRPAVQSMWSWLHGKLSRKS